MPPEDLRFEVRLFLYGRPLASEEAVGIVHHLSRKGLRANVDEVTASLVFLEGMNPAQVKRHQNPLGGGVPRWQITSAGVLAHERGE